MKCEYLYCNNEINKDNCFISGADEKNKTYWCSEECYKKHINNIKPKLNERVERLEKT